MSRRYQAIFFDMGSTLVKQAEPVPPAEAWARALAQLGDAVAPAALAAAHARAVQEMAALLQPPPEGQPEELATHVAVWSEVYRRILSDAGIRSDLERAVAAMWDVWLAGIWKVYPEVPEVLQALAAQGYRLGIISNWTPTLEETCHRLGLTRCCDVIVASATVGYAKPHPRIFQAALDRAGVRPKEALHVGDCYDTDVIGARAVGMDAVLLQRRHRSGTVAQGVLAWTAGEPSQDTPPLPALAVARIGSLRELPQLIGPAHRPK